MKYLLTALALWSFGWGIYFGVINHSQHGFQIGIMLGFFCAFGAIVSTAIKNK